MSHTTKLKTVIIRDVSALRSAVAELAASGIKCHMIENAKPRMYYAGQGEVCDYVLKLDAGKYDVGFEKQEDGTYVPVFDEYANYVGDFLGADRAVCPLPSTREGKVQHQLGKFFQSYAKHAAINVAIASGYMVENTTTDAAGNVHLVLGGM